LNRAVFSFNDFLDRAALEPLALGYRAITPAPVDRGVTNFFNNLSDVGSAINNLLQLKVGRAFSDVGRVAVNTTLGVLGLFDVASNMDLPRYNEDFGQTLGVWGFGAGPYLVLPLLGPSSGRDAVGLVGDYFTDPVTYIEDDSVRWGLRGLNLIDTRADLLSASRVLEQAALDRYSFVRDAFLQQRENLIHDGNPPEDFYYPPEEFDYPQEESDGGPPAE
jgi:phospholipid-binding lipoprotein MlaA